MSTNTVVEGEGGPGNRWWLAALLALLIVVIIGGVLLAKNRRLFAGSPTATPRIHFVTATPRPLTATPKPGPTATPKPGPTGTPKPGPTGTPKPGGIGTARPGPTGTPKPGPTVTSGPQTGTITYSQLQLNSIQQGANRKNPQFTFYLDPFQVVRRTLPKYGFTGAFTIVSPPQPPQPTPTPFTNSQGQPEVQITVGYLGHKYMVVLVQPVQKGASGIWVINQITQSS